jgi:hypothetical protein
VRQQHVFEGIILLRALVTQVQSIGFLQARGEIGGLELEHDGPIIEAFRAVKYEIGSGAPPSF